jgi:hypothetical protein
MSVLRWTYHTTLGQRQLCSNGDGSEIRGGACAWPCDAGLEEATGLKALADCTLGSPCVLGWENTLTVDGQVKYTARQRGPLASNQSVVETIQVNTPVNFALEAS